MGVHTPFIIDFNYLRQKGVGDVKMEKLIHVIVPFIFVSIIVLFLVTYIPFLTTYLPSVLNK